MLRKLTEDRWQGQDETNVSKRKHLRKTILVKADKKEEEKLFIHSFRFVLLGVYLNLASYYDLFSVYF